MDMRCQFRDHAATATFDAAIIGGGVVGACLYHHLCERGHRVLLVDRSDFAGGSSQSSGMLVWGGLLYLRNFDLPAVFRFSRARDALIETKHDWVRPKTMRYIPAGADGSARHVVHFGLYLYWLMGMFHRRQPAEERDFGERELIRDPAGRPALVYEEGALEHSDARFVLHWITPHQSPEQVPLNYCAVAGGEYAEGERLWHLQLQDTLAGNEFTARARTVINCAGPWADDVNRLFGIRTPCRHVFSKGVYIGMRRPDAHQALLVFEMGEHGDVLTYMPWGPVSLWGPTETRIDDLAQGYRADAADVSFLLEHANRNLDSAIARDDIVSLRSGVRPLVVPNDFDKDVYPLEISRGHRIVADAHRPWVSFFGGKLTDCVEAAAAIYARLPKSRFAPPRMNGVAHDAIGAIELTTWPGVDEPVPSARWCAQHEFCRTPADYLRRRTNIAQWLPREGLGRNDEHLPEIERIALDLSGGDAALAAQQVASYRRSVAENFDEVIASV
jgi:glycerol-3-phosphate dehydrogenase